MLGYRLGVGLMRVFRVSVCALMVVLLALSLVTVAYYVKSMELLRGYPDISFSVDLTVNSSNVRFSGYGLEVSLHDHRVRFGRLVYDLSLDAYLELNGTRARLLKSVKLNERVSTWLSIDDVERELTHLPLSEGTEVCLAIIPSFNTLEVVSGSTYGGLGRETLVSVHPWSPLIIKVPVEYVGGKLRFKPSETRVEGVGVSVVKTPQEGGELNGVHYHVLVKASRENQPIRMIEYVPDEAFVARQLVMNTLVPVLTILAILSSITAIAYLIKFK